MSSERLSAESLEQYKIKTRSSYLEIFDRCMRRYDTSGVMGEEGELSPSYRLDFDLNKQEAVFEISHNTGFTEEERRYVFTRDTVRLEGYVDTEMQRNSYDRTIYFTTDKDTAFLLEGDIISDPLDVDLEELENVANLILDPKENAHLLERLQPLEPKPSQF